MHAREKSKPLECLGNDVAGEAERSLAAVCMYISFSSSLGLSGAGCSRDHPLPFALPEAADGEAGAGICNERPLAKSGLREKGFFCSVGV